MSRSKPIKPDNIEFYRTLSLNIRYFREAAGIRSADLASTIDISPSYLATLESPARYDEHPSLEVLFDISKALNIHPSDLLKDLTERARERPARDTVSAEPPRDGAMFPYDVSLPPVDDRIAECGEWMYERRLGDLIDLFGNDGYEFIRICIRHFDHRRSHRG